MNQAKENTKKQKLVAKHYPTYDFALRYGFVVPITFGGPLVFQTYGLTGGFVVLGLILFLLPLLHMASLFLLEQARLREAEGDEGYKAQVKLIKKQYSVDYFAFIFFASFGGSFLGIYLSDFGIFQLHLDLSSFVYAGRSLGTSQASKKSKLREQKQNE